MLLQDSSLIKALSLFSELKTRLKRDSLPDRLEVPTCQKFMASFRLISQNDVNRIPGVVKATICKLDPCPTLLVKSCCEKVNVPPVKVINISLTGGRFTGPL